MSFQFGFSRSLVSVLALGTILIGLMFILPLGPESEPVSLAPEETHQALIEAWRSSRHARLSRADGWLTLVGLEWLKQGENRIGSALDNDIHIPGAPDHWGTVVLRDGQLKFLNSNQHKVTINGESVPSSSLVPDTEGEPTVVTSGSVSFHVIYRASYALRIKDTKAKSLLDFRGVDNYSIEESWKVKGHFVPAEKGSRIEITNVLGQVSDSPAYGTLEFNRDGKTHSLLGIGDEESENLWFIFADRTSGRGTYGAGRFLYSDGMPKNGWLTVDFNKAYNPPCAFNPYSTCPLPPQRNRMDLLVTAGEKDFHPDSS